LAERCVPPRDAALRQAAEQLVLGGMQRGGLVVVLQSAVTVNANAIVVEAELELGHRR
jgi:hypothetical protein